MPEVSVCICTFRRAAQLRLLLQDLAAQTHRPQQVVVVDNDPSGSGRPGTEGDWPFALHYDIQPERNISLTRNRTIAHATGEWIGILDDDERVPADWLATMLSTAAEGGAEVVVGPVLYRLPEDAPGWISPALFPTPRHTHGRPFPINRIGGGNALLKASRVRAQCREGWGPYDPALGITGGEDVEFFLRLHHAGAVMVWCDRVAAWEPVAAERLNWRWIRRRALRGGQDYARNTRLGHFAPRRPWTAPAFLAEALVKLLIAAAVCLLWLPLSRRRAAPWAVKLWANAGKLGGWFGAHYREYAPRPGERSA
ncbi:MAG TPA: glycosyltransferase family 2 protein [Nevskiaceae bacterium]|nr:glycosyltransferase family 2 protein [Nevskiaceae bacterium]